jgi:hypothetical protein
MCFSGTFCLQREKKITCLECVTWVLCVVSQTYLTVLDNLCLPQSFSVCPNAQIFMVKKPNVGLVGIESSDNRKMVCKLLIEPDVLKIARAIIQNLLGRLFHSTFDWSINNQSFSDSFFIGQLRFTFDESPSLCPKYNLQTQR